MNTAPTLRLHLFFARDAETAVILRQGPSEVFRMILWNVAKDTFEEGQWVKHKVYVDSCDLSPDGRHFLYFALDGKWGSKAKGSFTAISRPPFFTALALYPVGDTWSGGGVFVDNETIVADGAKDIIGRAEGLRRYTRSWNAAEQRFVYKTHTGHQVTLRKLDDPATPYASKPNAARSHPDYETEGAKLYRLRAGERHLIRDFTDMAFEPIRAPYDWREPGEDGFVAWHPLDSDTP